MSRYGKTPDASLVRGAASGGGELCHSQSHHSTNGRRAQPLRELRDIWEHEAEHGGGMG